MARRRRASGRVRHHLRDGRIVFGPPYELRKEIGAFIEVYCRAPMEVLLSRDDSGLFARAQRGEVEHVAGINAPFEEPLKPEVLLNTDTDSPENCCAKVIATLEVLNLIERVEGSTYTADEETMIKQRLRDLGYL